MGWDYVFVAVDDHSRVAFTQVYPDESRHSVGALLRAAVGHFKRWGVPVQRVLTNNSMSFKSGLRGLPGAGHHAEVNRPGMELTPTSWTVATPPIRRCFSAGTLPG